ncbi:MAG TPA: aminotransferase class V-fold PLP-dependent enzyme [Xanthobacteraceae bacterium]|nr:aminotransferase class V-fold PLP-dependent enzyme [Xanthobacteraceae bacterium]
MSVSEGRQFLSIPGPTNVPDAVLQAMQRPAIDIYSGEIIDITDSCLKDLAAIFRTGGRAYIYAANGHGGWEAALCNVLSRGDLVLVLESGRFATRWGEMARMLGLEVEVLPGHSRRAVDPAALEERLRRDKGHLIKAILTVQIDTASGVVNDIPAIRRAIDAPGHPALLMVDAVASLGCMPFEMDAWGVDVAVSASQKGLMAPPGLGFVAANSRARKVHETAGLRTTYWDWTLREGEELYQKYCGTAPEHLLFGLRKAVDLFLAEGLDGAIRRHALLAEATRAAVAKWAEGATLAFNVERPAERANSVTCVATPRIDPAPLLSYCRDKCGVVLGIGIGALVGKGFRLAHMGHVNAPMVLGTLGVVEMGLKALAIPHGSGGVQAAVEYLGREVRETEPTRTRCLLAAGA